MKSKTRRARVAKGRSTDTEALVAWLRYKAKWARIWEDDEKAEMLTLAAKKIAAQKPSAVKRFLKHPRYKELTRYYKDQWAARWQNPNGYTDLHKTAEKACAAALAKMEEK